MTPQEWWWVYDAKAQEPHIGNTSLTEAEADELYQDLMKG